MVSVAISQQSAERSIEFVVPGTRKRRADGQPAWERSRRVRLSLSSGSAYATDPAASGKIDSGPGGKHVKHGVPQSTVPQLALGVDVTLKAEQLPELLTLRSMTTFLGVWHQSLGVTSKWLRGRRCVRGGDSRLHCTVLPVVPLAGGRGSGYVARPPRKRAKTRQKPRTAPRCSVVSPCTGRNRASLRRSSEPLQASQARATLRRPAAPEDQSRRPRRTRLLPQERPRAEEAEVDVKMTPLSAETVRGS